MSLYTRFALHQDAHIHSGGGSLALSSSRVWGLDQMEEVVTEETRK